MTNDDLYEVRPSKRVTDLPGTDGATNPAWVGAAQPFRTTRMAYSGGLRYGSEYIAVMTMDGETGVVSGRDVSGYGVDLHPVRDGGAR